MALMAVVWATLMLAASALARANYGDYGIAKMPEYGSPADYEVALSRAPAPAPIADYRNHDYYDDDITGRTDKHRSKGAREKESEFESRHNTGKKANEHQKWSNDDANIETLDKYSPQEIVSKFKSNKLSVRSKARPRFSEKETDILPKRESKLIRNSDSGRDTDVPEQDDVHRHKGNYFGAKDSDFDYKDTTERSKKPRRIPRDQRLPGKQAEDSDYKMDEILRAAANLPSKDEDMEIDYPGSKTGKKSQDYIPYNEFRRIKPENTRKGTNRPPSRRKDSQNEDVVEAVPKKGQLTRESYDDYYDMKRLSKLPSLPRRSTTVATQSEMEQEQEVPRRRVQWMMNTSPWPWMPTLAKDYNLQKQNIKDRLLALNLGDQFRRAGAADDDQFLSTSTRETAKIITEPIITETITDQTITTTGTIVTILPSEKYEMSLAEKSRLSILKKALRKEFIGNITTNKPPVLYQLATNMQTIVMVEPAQPEAPLSLNNKLVFEDTPDRLKKVKRLMQKKIVDEAKSFSDLTNNWDDMVCDYIDMSLIDNAVKPKCSTFLMMLLFWLCKIFTYVEP